MTCLLACTRGRQPKSLPERQALALACLPLKKGACCWLRSPAPELAGSSCWLPARHLACPAIDAPLLMPWGARCWQAPPLAELLAWQSRTLLQASRHNVTSLTHFEMRRLQSASVGGGGEASRLTCLPTGELVSARQPARLGGSSPKRQNDKTKMTVTDPMTCVISHFTSIARPQSFLCHGSQEEEHQQA